MVKLSVCERGHPFESTKQLADPKLGLPTAAGICATCNGGRLDMCQGTRTFCSLRSSTAYFPSRPCWETRCSVVESLSELWPAQEEEKEVLTVKQDNVSNEAQVLEPAGIEAIEVSPSTPLISQDGIRNSDRKPFSTVATSESSPGNFPAKRLHPDGWKEVQDPQPATIASVTPSSMPRRSSGKKKETNHGAVHKLRTPGSPDKPANKKQKLEGGRLRQV